MADNAQHFVYPPFDDPDSYPLEWTSIHVSYIELVESLILGHLQGMGHDLETFWDLVEGLEGDEGKAMGAIVGGMVEFRAFIDVMKDGRKRDYYFNMLEMWAKTLGE